MMKLYKDRKNGIIECYNIQLLEELSNEEYNIVTSCIEPNILNHDIDEDEFVEYGPHLNMITPWCSNALSIFNKCGITKIERIEVTNLIKKEDFNENMIDPMLQCVYNEPITTLNLEGYGKKYKPDIVTDIKKYNEKYKLGFDEEDLEYYKNMYQELRRYPRDIELYDLAQSNSEHSRHWFFKGKLIKDGVELLETLFQMVKSTQNHTTKRSVLAFCDNASSLKGFKINTIKPKDFIYSPEEKEYNLTFTAETHNFPTGIAPFPGAATGTGGRIRDGHAIGKGGLIIAGTAGYCVGDITNSDYAEKNIKTLIEASNGASDYGNKFGEPLILGFCRSFGITNQNDGNRIEWVKPIMFSGGIGQMDDLHNYKETPQHDDLIIKVGGPAYRIGVGGGAASSRDQHEKNKNEDLNAVQRGDPEMENRLNRFIRTCVEMGEHNPILSIHDQGAGGTANVTKEIIYPVGGQAFINNINVGDSSMTPFEIWISEYQEQDTILIKNKSYNKLERISRRENCPISVIGYVKDSGKMEVFNDLEKVLELPLEQTVGNDIPQKKYYLESFNHQYEDFDIELENDNVLFHLHNVFRLPSVGSKRFLTNKVDRSVTGLIAQQQCVGHLQTPLSNYAIVAQSHFGLTGGITSIGERPICGLINPAALGRMSVGEMLTNMIFAKIDCLENIKCLENIRCSGNWMWPLKFKGEKNALYEACRAMCDISKELGLAFDGGKDSLSMSYTDNDGRVIKCPRALVVSGYAPTSNINIKVTPDFKNCDSDILVIDFFGKRRLGGSALAQTFDKIGTETPDVEDAKLLRDIFYKIQKLLEEGKILAGHDRSDGGLITTVCEMAFAGDVGFNIIIEEDPIPYLFNEELGLVIEVSPKYTEEIAELFKGNIVVLGKTTIQNRAIIHGKSGILLNESVATLRDSWELNSFEMEMKQCNNKCVKMEKLLISKKCKFNYKAQFKIPKIYNPRSHKVAVIREEGSNGDREMASAFYMAGFEVFDYCMNDFLEDAVNLNSFRGIAFVGGFSYSDVFGAANGWYNVINSNKKIREQFNQFYERRDTFSLGICNGCQLMARLDWIPKCKLLENESGRFESRFSYVKINNSKSILFREMEESYLGIWVAHKEGRFVLKENITTEVTPMQYIDDKNNITKDYPYNPNGSEYGVASLCSYDGRHTAMMPHPERCFLNWQWPDNIGEGIIDKHYSPWFRIFINAYLWCEENEKI